TNVLKKLVSPKILREKPGSCPMNAIHCNQKSFELCIGDGGCPGKEKCCGYRCGKASPAYSAALYIET
uniref:WAP domain-containing protein n=1 Tax=Leptobrachium leishanense TaxID=445787 RepID=A0A8C5MEE6_9ANUR